MRAITPFLAGCVVVLTLVMSPERAEAQRVVIDGRSQDSVLRLERRLAPEQAIRAMTSRSGNVDMLHIDGAVVLQLTDAGIDRIRVGEKAESQSGLGRLFEELVVGGLRVLLDRAMVHDLRDIGDVRYEADEIIFEDRTGNRVFQSLNVHGENVLQSFDDAEARAFVAHLRRHLQR
jgi:hypothetical protein